LTTQSPAGSQPSRAGHGNRITTHPIWIDSPTICINKHPGAICRFGVFAFSSAPIIQERILDFGLPILDWRPESKIRNRKSNILFIVAAPCED
jgi:hypothetical protein